MSDRRLPDWIQERFPRASRYPLEQVLANEMGPNVLWLTEALCEHMQLEPGQRVLDMGCGRALSSIFLAREFGVEVWANDLWIAASDNWQRIREAGLERQITPVHAEAHALPYVDEFFDAAVSLDSYHYYGNADLYLKRFAPLVKPGGRLGIVAPGWVEEPEGDSPPEHLTRRQASGGVFWDPDCWTFHSAGWWRRHWTRSGLVEVERAELIPDGWKLWLEWERIRDGGGFSGFPSDAEALEADGGRTLGLVLMTATRRAVDATGGSGGDGPAPLVEPVT